MFLPFQFGRPLPLEGSITFKSSTIIYGQSRSRFHGRSCLEVGRNNHLTVRRIIHLMIGCSQACFIDQTLLVGRDLNYPVGMNFNDWSGTRDLNNWSVMLDLDLRTRSIGSILNFHTLKSLQIVRLT
ncbi:hypothetical protein ZOSMA_1G01090 [Zostera marina]|uniref:Uncharacterized protein n=1 Tax=Zostera marina TaxID=29655 RepID=A0A0K9PMF6_ZOSMR|nr:hypothetical protein ZOSMA_1G01090 [Zostera marina]